MHEVEGCRDGRHGVMYGGAWCHNGNSSVGEAACRFTRSGRVVLEREQITDGEQLGGEQTIESAEAESAAPAKKIRNMGRLESCLAGEESSIHTASIDPPEEFPAEALLQLGEIHCGNDGRSAVSRGCAVRRLDDASAGELYACGGVQRELSRQRREL